MENNQEHKVDKIFKDSLENQSFIPPTNAWMGIYTYTIGQEESKKKVWLRYASLVMLFLVVSGFGLWYFVDNQVIKLANDSSISVTGVSNEQTPTLLSHEFSDCASQWKNTHNGRNTGTHSQKTASKNAGRVLNPASVSTNPITQHTQTFLTHDKEKTRQLSKLPSQEEFVKTNKIDKEPLIVEIEDVSLVNDNIEFVEPVCYFNQYKTEEIVSKPLIVNDLSEKMQKKSEGKIVALEKNFEDKKEVDKADSVAYGKGFSLKHPIINFRLGLYNNSVKMSANQGGEIPFANDVINSNNIYAFLPTFAVAWKLNKKSRISLNFKYVNYSTVNIQSKSGAAYVDPLSPTNKPTGTFKYNSSGDFYQYLTPFGYVTQPIDPKFSFTPKDFNVRLYGKFSAWQIGTNYEYDLIAFRNKKGGIPAMEIYGLVGLNIQKINKYSYSYYPFKNYDPKDSIIDLVPYNPTNYTQTELGNGSPIVFGYNTGLGVRLQLSKRFGLNISGNYENSINSWVKDLPFITRLSLLSVESGFFVNL